MKTAITGLLEADSAFESLERALPRDINKREWEEAEDHALLMRGEALRIFDVQSDKGR